MHSFNVRSALRVVVPTVAFLALLVAASADFGGFISMAFSAADDHARVEAANGRIIYQRGPNATSDLYAITAGSGTSIGLRRGYHPAVSPDGTKVAFVDNTPGPTNGFLMLMNPDGTNVRQLATPRQGFTPTWSPNGTRLAYVKGDFDSVGDNGKGRLYIVDMLPGAEGANESELPLSAEFVSKPAWGSTNRIAFGVLQTRTGGGFDGLGVGVTESIPASPSLYTFNYALIATGHTSDREPTWEPEGLFLAYISTRDYPMANASEIYMSAANGASPRRLTNTATFKSQPSWSPDGVTIAFSQGGTQGPNNANVRSVSSACSNCTTSAMITGFSSGDRFPNWGALPSAASPTPTPSVSNGKIAFERFTNSAGVTQVYSVSDVAGATATVLCGGTAESRRPAYSHDGTKLAFMRANTIWTANADCTNQFSTGSSGDNPTWSPDGTKIAFTRGSSFTDIWTMNADGTGQTKLTDIATETKPNGSFSNTQPSWGPNNKIVFRGTFRKIVNGSLTSVGDIWTMEPNGTNFVRLTDDPVHAYAPDWSPDSSKIVFASNRATNKGEIYTMDAAGTNLTRITNNATISNSNPAWSPDGTKIVHDDDFSNITRRNIDGTNSGVLAFGNFPDWQMTAEAPASVDLAMETMTDDTDPVAKGSNYNYVFGLRNRSTTTATGVKIVFDPIPSNIRVHPIMLNCSMATDRRVTCTFADIAPGATASRSVIFIADVEGTANVRATVSSNQSDPDTTNNSLTQATVIVIPADVALLDPSSAAQVGLGENLTYQLRVANLGPAAARGVRLESTLSPELEFVSATAGCVRAGNRITCELGDITATCPNPSSGCPTASLREVSITARGIQLGVGAFAARNDVVVTTQGSLDDSTFNNNRTIRTDVVSRLQLIGLEAVQVIQDMANSLPLVQGKETVVRAHIKNLGTGNPQVLGHLIGVRIGPSGTRTALGSLAPTNAGGSIKVLQNPSRGSLDDSLYFELPANWREGTVELEFRGSGAAVTCSEPDGTPNCKTTISLVPTTDLSIKFVFLTFNETDGTAHTPTLTDLLYVARELYGQLPVDELSIDLSETTISKERACASNFTSVVKQLNDMRLNDCKTGDCKDYYMGLLADKSACTGTPLNGQADIPGRSSVVFVPTDRSNTRAHEFGHDLGLSHTNFVGSEGCGNAAGLTVPCTHTPSDGTISATKPQYTSTTAYGFDVGNWSGTRIYDAATADFMSYAAVRWPSASNYSRMFECFTTRNCVTSRFRPGHDSLQTRPAQIAADRVVLIDGEVSLATGAAVLGSVFISNATRPITTPEPGNYAIRFENGAGAEIASHAFSPSMPSEGSTASISLMLPWNDATRRIVMTRDGVAIASRQASPNSPTVTVTSPNGGETLSGSATTFTWTASDPDGDPLTYALEFSKDNGVTWKSLAINWTSTSLPVDLTTLSGSNQALFRVTASDGFHSTEDQSNAVFTVPPHAPLASAVTPSNNLYVSDQTINLNGTGFDIEDGMLAGQRLTWSSNLNGLLGTGSSLSVSALTLAEGDHTITLSATDSTNRVGTTSITIRVFRVRPAFPAALSAGPAGLAFSAPMASGLTSPQSVAIRNTGDGILTWSATVDQAWIRLGSAAGVAPADPEVRADPTGLAPGNYSGKITIVSSDAANSPQIIQVSLSITQAPPATVSGRVVTPSGLGLRNAVVSMVDSQGFRRTATTSSFGIFTFANVPVGDSYTVTVSSKRYRFAPRTISQLGGNLNLGDLVGLE